MNTLIFAFKNSPRIFDRLCELFRRNQIAFMSFPRRNQIANLRDLSQTNQIHISYRSRKTLSPFSIPPFWALSIFLEDFFIASLTSSPRNFLDHRFFFSSDFFYAFVTNFRFLFKSKESKAESRLAVLAGKTDLKLAFAWKMSRKKLAFGWLSNAIFTPSLDRYHRWSLHQNKSSYS